MKNATTSVCWSRYLGPVLLILLLLIINRSCKKESSVDLPAQDTWTTFSQSGLSSCSIYSIVQDRNGDIWAGSYGNGLYKYSGGAWTNFTTSNSGLLDNYILSLKVDPDGILWIGAFDGITKLSGTNWSTVTTDAPVLSIEYYKFDHSLFFGLAGTGFINYAGGSFQSYYFLDSTMNYINTIYSDNQNYLWFGTKNGIYRMGSNYKMVAITTSNGLNNNYVKCFFEDSQGRLWVGTFGGTRMQWFQNGIFHNAPYMSGYDQNYNLAISQDMFSSLWFGMISSGALKYNGSIMEPVTTQDGLCGNTIISICRDSQNRMWFGSLSGGISMLQQAMPRNY